MKDSEGLDVPLIRLRPLRDRKITKREFDRILSSIKAVGLLEPLVVYPEGDDYVILDGTSSPSESFIVFFYLFCLHG